MPKFGHPYQTACKLQQLIVERCKAESVRGIDLAALTRAWDALEDRKRKLRMKPLPKSVEVGVKLVFQEGNGLVLGCACGCEV